MIAVASMFFLCQLPYGLMHGPLTIELQKAADPETWRWVRHAAKLGKLVNHALTFFFYTSGTRFKQAILAMLKQALCCGKRQSHVRRQTMTMTGSTRLSEARSSALLSRASVKELQL